MNQAEPSQAEVDLAEVARLVSEGKQVTDPAAQARSGCSFKRVSAGYSARC